MTTTTTKIIEALNLLHEPGQVFEIRIIDAPKTNGFKVTMAGYFDDHTTAAKAIASYNGKANIYTTLNPVDPALLARAANRLKETGKRDALTGDKDIARRCWLAIDIDPARPAGISSTEAELTEALALADRVAAYLAEWGWPAPVVAHSGNGAHLLYRVDLPNDDQSTAAIKGALEHLAGRFNFGGAKVDTTVFNAARIWKLYGTIAVKGDNLLDRPHRLATIETIPATLEVVTLAQIQAIAPPPAPAGPPPVYRNGAGYHATEIDAALTALNVSAHKKTDSGGREVWALDRCLTSTEHLDGACITLEAGGKAGYKCHHLSCAGKDWQAVKPLLFPERATGQNGNGKTQQSGNGTTQPVKPVKPSDDILRDRWIKTAGRVVYGLGEWRRYHAGLWPPVKPAIVKREITRVLEAAKVEGVLPTSNRLASVVELAKNELTIADDSIFDGNPDYLVCGNGALHIGTKKLEPHKPELYATTGLIYDYSTTAAAAHWQTFLIDLELSIGADVVEFLQEFAGYALTTDTRHELAIWLYGPPGGGKSTFITGIQAMLGNRAGLLGLAAVERSQFALGNLPGKTLMLAMEQPAMYIKSTDVLNAIISGEPITVERKFSDPIEITPRAKILWAMNELPRVQEAGNGIFRRVKVVEFPAIPEGSKDPALKEGIKTEGAGILNWALTGLERLTRRGRFVIPNSVKAATDDFQSHNDIPALFVQDCCVTGLDANGEQYRAHTNTLYGAYKQWCMDNGHKAQSTTSIANDWKRLGFEKRRPGGVVHWFGVGLRA